MPIYEFQCTGCHDLFEEFAKLGTRTAKCPQCGAKGKKIISNVGIAFKGGGFHVNDYTAKPVNGNGAKPSESAPSKAENGSGETGSTDKPATKSEGGGSSED